MLSLPYKHFALWSSLCLVLLSCDAIFEDDISREIISLVSPADGYVSEIQNTSFQWAENDKIAAYRLQIASPNFEAPDFFELDTLISEASFNHTLFSGNYQWRVRGENSASETIYTTRSIEITGTESLSNQSFTVNSPSSGTATPDSLITFLWNPLEEATSYLFEFYTNDNGSLGELAFSNVTNESNSASFLISEGNYLWRAAAINALPSISLFSEERSLIIDNTTPTAVNLIEPVSGSFLNSESTLFSWTVSTDVNLSSYVLKIYSDSEFTSLIYSDASVTNSIEIDLSELDIGTYYWIIEATDLAGNSSTSSSFIFSL